VDECKPLVLGIANGSERGLRQMIAQGDREAEFTMGYSLVSQAGCFTDAAAAGRASTIGKVGLAL